MRRKRKSAVVSNSRINDQNWWMLRPRRNLRWHRKITVNIFVTVALVATIAIGEFRAAAIIVFIMAIAGALESYTLDKTRSSIRILLDLTPNMAAVLKVLSPTGMKKARIKKPRIHKNILYSSFQFIINDSYYDEMLIINKSYKS